MTIKCNRTEYWVVTATECCNWSSADMPIFPLFVRILHSSITHGIHEIPLLQNNLKSTFLVTKWTPSSSKCVKTWSARVLPWTQLGEVSAYQTPYLAGEGTPPSHYHPLSTRAFYTWHLGLVPLSHFEKLTSLVLVWMMCTFYSTCST